MRTEEARGQAAAYVWGRQDAGEGARDTGFSWLFANAYAMRQEAYNTQATWHMIPLQDAWREWHATGRLTYKASEHHNGGGWRAIGPDGDTERIIETSLPGEPAPIEPAAPARVESEATSVPGASA